MDKLVGQPDAEFRPGQLAALKAIFEDRRQALVVQRTGWGKSAVYFLATSLNRSRGHGPTVLISPLLALMRNQIEAATQLGLQAATVNSTNAEDWEAVFAQIANSEIDILLISPERLNNPKFRQDVLQRLMADIGLLVVDEAHCISDWGHDFRPDYQRVGRILQYLPEQTPVLMTTATANQRVVDDIVDQLGGDLEVIRGSLDRESLRLDAIELGSRAERLGWLADNVKKMPGSGIIYTLTVRDSEQVAAFLQHEGIDAVAYSGTTNLEIKLRVEQNLAANDVKAVVATSALGMGYDKPDLKWVVHYQSPGSPIAYYQQVGRAGRAVDDSWGVLLSGDDDKEIQDFFIATAFPTPEQAETILDALEQSDGLKVGAILQKVNLRDQRLRGFLKQLEVSGFLEQDGGRWYRTIKEWRYPTDRVTAVTNQRRHEQRSMVEYVKTTDCRMRFLRNLLDDDQATDCGRCSACTGRGMPPHPSEEAVQRAEAFLGSLHPTIEPRKVWPVGADRSGLPKFVPFETGVALTREGSPTTGRLVVRGKRVDHRFDNRLIFELAEVISQRGLTDHVSYLTFVPSTSSNLVSDLAERLGSKLRLPVIETLRALPGPPQAEMENSSTQMRNALSKLEVVADPPAGGGLLVDDIVDSRWTLTVAANLLAARGSGPLYPVVLADASYG